MTLQTSVPSMPAPLATHSTPRIVFDPAAFHPLRVMAVRHTLENHPLLQLPAIVDVAQRLGNKITVRFHDDRATPSTDFTNAPTSNPVNGRPEDIVRSIESAHAWLALLGVHHDPEYRALLDQILGSVRPVVEARDPGMSYRRADIFVASPGAVTPYHMDHEHNFILQVRGRKLLNVCEPLDREVVTERSLELFHATSRRDLVVYQDRFEDRAHHFQLEPGMGGYMPTTAPHWVKNGDNVSITISFTYYSDALRRRKLLHRGNYYMRKMQLPVSPVGTSGLHDALNYAAFCTVFAVRDFTHRSNGKHFEDFTSYYGN